MKVYTPAISVTLYKARQRTELTTGLAASDRLSKLTKVDLTPYLSEQGGLQTSKSVSAPAGGFSLTLFDQPEPLTGETLYALIEPMDLIEIRMARSPEVYAATGSAIPVVMRGLVSSVNRSMVMAGDRPVRSISVAGHDFGKVLQIIQIYYLTGASLPDNILSNWPWAFKYSMNPKIMPMAQFVEETLFQIVDPYLQSILQIQGADSLGASMFDSVTPNVTATGDINHQLLNQYRGSLYGLLTMLLDVGPFNEMFIEDGDVDISLVVRPLPYGPNGIAQTPVFVGPSDLVGITASRSDADVGNFYWVDMQATSLVKQDTMKMIAGQHPQSDYVLTNYFNAAESCFGLRRMETQSNLLPPNSGLSDAPTIDPSTLTDFVTWQGERLKALADTNKDNLLWESGTLQLKGSETIKPGTFLQLGPEGYTFTVYVQQVDHQFVPPGPASAGAGWMTSVHYIRGDGWVNRSASATPWYWNEIDLSGTK